MIIAGKKRKGLSLTLIILSITCLLTAIWGANRPQKNAKIQVEEKSVNFKASNIATFANGDISKRFLKKIKFRLDYNVNYFIYGNDYYGYYRSRDFIKNENEYTLSLIPPGYQHPIKMFARDQSGKVHNLPLQKFEVSLPPMFKRMSVNVQGKFSAPFFMKSGQFLPPGNLNNINDRFSYSYICNRLGEIVWIHLVNRGRTRMRKYGVLKQVGKGVYGALFGERTSFFEIVNYKGEVLKSFSTLDRKPFQVIHHDFIYTWGDKKLTVLGQIARSFRGYIPSLTFFQNLKLFFRDPISFTTSTIVDIDLETLKVKQNWQGHDFFSPIEKISMTGMNLYNYLISGGANEWSGRGERTTIDHIHANTLKPVFQGDKLKGYLVTARNDNRIIMIGADYKKVLWTIGHRERDTFKSTREIDRFYHPHDAHILENGRILVFDNHPSPPAPGTNGSRILELQVDELKGTYHTTWIYDPKGLFFVPTRGSVNKLANGNILAHFPNAKDMRLPEKERLAKDETLEIDYKTKEVVAHMRVDFTTRLGGGKKTTRAAGAKALPIYSLGLEEHIKRNTK